MSFKLAGMYIELTAPNRNVLQSLNVVRTACKRLEKTMLAVRTAGKRMFMIGAGIATPLGVAVKAAATFEYQMAEVATMLDENTMHYLPKFREGILQMSQDMGEATATLARGMYDILSAMIPPARALEVLGVSSRAAVGGLTDTGIAADAITTILNSFSLSADRAGDVADLLFAIVKRGKITFAGLAPQIGRTAALSALAGLSLEDMGAALATMTRSGLRARLAVTALNGILRAFITEPGREAAEVADEFRIALNTEFLSAVGLIGVLKRLKGARAEQIAVMFPSLRGIIGVSIAVQQLTGFTDDYSVMVDRATLADAAFQKMAATLVFQTRRLWQTLRALSVTVGEILIPRMEKLVKWLREAEEGMIKWVKANPQMVTGLVKLAAGLMAAGAGLYAIGILFTPGGILAGIVIAIAAWTGKLDTFIAKLRELFDIQISGLKISEWIEVAILKAKNKLEEFATFVRILVAGIMASIRIEVTSFLDNLPPLLKKALGIGGAAGKIVGLGMATAAKDYAQFLGYRTTDTPGKFEFPSIFGRRGEKAPLAEEPAGKIMQGFRDFVTALKRTTVANITARKADVATLLKKRGAVLGAAAFMRKRARPPMEYGAGEIPAEPEAAPAKKGPSVEDMLRRALEALGEEIQPVAPAVSGLLEYSRRIQEAVFGDEQKQQKRAVKDNTKAVQENTGAVKALDAAFEKATLGGGLVMEE